MPVEANLGKFGRIVVGEIALQMDLGQRRLGVVSGITVICWVGAGFSKLPPKNARASRPDRSARGTRGGCRTAGRHPRRHAKSNLFAARRRPVRVPRDRRRSPSRPARRARSTRRAWPRSRAQYFEPATRAEVGAMLTADPTPSRRTTSPAERPGPIGTGIRIAAGPGSAMSRRGSGTS